MAHAQQHRKFMDTTHSTAYRTHENQNIMLLQIGKFYIENNKIAERISAYFAVCVCVCARALSLLTSYIMHRINFNLVGTLARYRAVGGRNTEQQQHHNLLLKPDTEFNSTVLLFYSHNCNLNDVDINT